MTPQGQSEQCRYLPHNVSPYTSSAHLVCRKYVDGDVGTACLLAIARRYAQKCILAKLTASLALQARQLAYLCEHKIQVYT